MNRPVHILGPGALGCLWAARLAPHLPVILVGRVSSTGTKSFTLVMPTALEPQPYRQGPAQPHRQGPVQPIASQGPGQNAVPEAGAASCTSQRHDTVSSYGSEVNQRASPDSGRQPVPGQNREGNRIRVSLPYFDWTPLSETASGAPLEEILVFTKSHATLAALEDLRPWMGPHTRIILFQNGLGSQMAVLKAFPLHTVLAAVTTEGANRPDADTVVHAGTGVTRLGILQAPPGIDASSLLEACAERLGRSGLNIATTANIRAFLWEKLALNCAINPFTALFDCANGEVPEQPGFRSVWPALRMELSAMLAQVGYPVAADDFQARVFDVMHKTRLNISSMLQDVRAGRPTEIDDINGFAWRYLQENGLPHAANRDLWSRVRSLPCEPTKAGRQP